MTQVFISYKSEDRERLRPLVQAFEAAGIEVWWDARIEGGSAWRETIEQQLEAARCVLVVWSERSIGPGGRFVRDEAAWALNRGNYLPILIDAVRLPIGFGEVQALPLADWKGNRNDARFQTVLAAVRARIDSPRAAAESAAPTPTKPVPIPSKVNRRAVLGGGAVLALGALGGGLWALMHPRPAKAKDDSIAVLPFANLSDDPTQSYFSEGLAEELRGALSRIASLKVIGRASCERVKDLPANEVASKLSVATVLTGSVRRSPALLRVSTQLVDGATGVELWSQTYDRPPGDVLEIQSGIAESVARALRFRLAPAEKAALAAGGTSNTEAHDLFLRAQAVSEASDEEGAIHKALSLCEAALALDPNYQEARVQHVALLVLVEGYAHSVEDSQSLLTQAEAEARRAIDLAPGLANGYATLGHVLLVRLEIPEGLAQLRRAVAISADDVQTLRSYASALAGIGRADEALELSRRAVSLDPLNPIAYANRALTFFYARRFTEGAAAARRTLALSPNRPGTRTTLGDCLVLMGQNGDAQAEYAQVPADDPFRLTGEAILAARTGNRALANEQLSRLKQLYGHTASFQEAEIRAQLGDLDEVFGALDRAWAVKDSGLSELAADPWLDPVRQDPRFKAVLMKLRIPA